MGVAPDSSLYEVNSHFLLPFELDRKPDVVLFEFVDKFEERTLLENVIGKLILNMGYHLKELCVVDLRVSKDVPQRIGQGSFDLQQRFKGHFVDLFETDSIELREILDLKLTN